MLTLEMLNNSKYKDATLVAEIKKINYFFNSISLTLFL